MKLDYNILWFEDIKTAFEAKKELVREVVEDFGFNFPEPRNEINGDNLNNINFDDFDLIIADLNLSGESGTNLIRKLREDEDVFTEVVFYSSDGENAVREELRKHGIDGVYCASREGYEFEEKVKKVIKTTIKKVQDINNMRGLIMAETSDLDEQMFEILEKVIGSDEKFDSLPAYVFEKVEKFMSLKEKDFVTFKENADISGLLGDTLLLDSYKRSQGIQRIVKILNDNELDVLKNFCQDYLKEVINIRNMFAHVAPSIDEKGQKVLKNKKGDFIFTDENCKNIRESLRKHASNLQKLKDTL